VAVAVAVAVTETRGSGQLIDDNSEPFTEISEAIKKE